MLKRHSLAGFTLVEIMIAVAVVAILVAVALPSYQNFTIRSKVTECLTLSAETKLAVSLAVARAGNATALSTAPGSFNPTRYCGDISVTPVGEIVMTTRNSGASEDPVLQLTPTSAGGSLQWTCGLVSGSPAHVPAGCRETALASNLPIGASPAAPSTPTPPWTPPPSGGDGNPGAPATPPDATEPGDGTTPPAVPEEPAPPSGPAPGAPTPPADPPATPGPSDGDPTPAPTPGPGPSSPPPGDAPGTGPGPGGDEDERSEREECLATMPAILRWLCAFV